MERIPRVVAAMCFGVAALTSLPSCKSGTAGVSKPGRLAAHTGARLLRIASDGRLVLARPLDGRVAVVTVRAGALEETPLFEVTGAVAAHAASSSATRGYFTEGLRCLVGGQLPCAGYRGSLVVAGAGIPESRVPMTEVAAILPLEDGSAIVAGTAQDDREPGFYVLSPTAELRRVDGPTRYRGETVGLTELGGKRVLAKSSRNAFTFDVDGTGAKVLVSAEGYRALLSAVPQAPRWDAPASPIVSLMEAPDSFDVSTQTLWHGVPE